MFQVAEVALVCLENRLLHQQELRVQPPDRDAAVSSKIFQDPAKLVWKVPKNLQETSDRHQGCNYRGDCSGRHSQ